MPLYGSSRRDSRRNNTRRAAFFTSIGVIALTLLALPQAANAQETLLEAKRSGNLLYTDITLLTPRDREVFSSLQQGLRAEIVFHVKIYRKSGGMLRFLGDRLVEEVRPAYQAYRDPFSQVYELIDEKGSVSIFKDWEDFLQRFFTLQEFPISIPAEHRDTGLTVLAQIRLRSVKLVPPLNLVGALIPLGQSATPWTSVPIAGPGKQ